MATDSPDLAQRQCCRCQETKPAVEFRFSGGKRPRYQSCCRQCENASQRDHYKQNGRRQPCRSKEARRNEHRREAERAGKSYRTRDEVTAAILSPEERAERARASSRAYAAAHREERRAAARNYQIAQRKKRHAEYLAANPEIRHYECKSQEEFDAFRLGLSPWMLFEGDSDQYTARYRLDDGFHEKEVNRTAMRRESRPDWHLQWSLRTAFVAIEDDRHSPYKRLAEEQLGYSLSELRWHLESKMEHGMTWKLYLDAYIVIDHIKPICRFNMTDPDQSRECWALSNLQPLWAPDNQRKSRKDGDG